MLNSLNKQRRTQHLTCDVAVVGAGLAGLFLADDLARRDLRVIVLESGSRTQDAEEHVLNAVEQHAEVYKGAVYGRFRCLGGTSTRWGGALLPYLDCDLGPHPLGWHDGWQVDPEELRVELDEVQDRFGVDGDAFEGDGELCGLIPGYLPRLPKWPSFAKRNAATLFRDRLRSSDRLQVWLDASVTSIRTDDGRACGVVAESLGGNRLDVEATTVVLCAGAIETTRLLLLMNRTLNGRVFSPNSPLGHGFHDHLSAPIADIVGGSPREIARLFSFRFVRGGMRNLRFELSPGARRNKPMPAAFLHAAFTRDGESGFDGLRGLFQALQKRSAPAAADVWRIFRDVPWFAEAVYWRCMEKRVLPPSRAGFELHLVTEQKPHRDNRITLSETARDPLGQPLAAIAWSVRSEDESAFMDVASHAETAWQAGELNKVMQLRPRQPEAVAAALRVGGGIYHPAGTTRIGLDATDGVVDRQLNVHGVPGLRALATSVFPGVGGTSPSLALVQLALRMSKDIAQTCR